GWVRGNQAALYDGVVAPNPACSPCTCGKPTGVGCTVVNMFCSANQNGCGGNVQFSQTAVSGAGNCTNIVENNGVRVAQSCQLNIGGATGGSCAVTGGGVKQPYTWTHVHDLCTPAAACQGDACLADGSGGYPMRACVAQAGFAGCPQGYPNATIYYADANDS